MLFTSDYPNGNGRPPLRWGC